MQVAEAVHRYGKALGVRVLPVYGGQPIGRQLHAMRSGVDVVVATPGRALDHLRRGSLALGGVRVVVLDEADEMLDMGFAEDIEAVLKEAPAGAPDRALLGDHAAAHRGDRQAQPARPGAHPHRQARDEGGRGAEGAAAGLPPAAATRRWPRSGRILDLEAPAAALVFCRTRTEVDELTETLNARGYQSEALHGGMTQEQRDKVMSRLRAGRRRAADRHRRRGARARHRPPHPRHQLRPARGARGLRAPHRPRRPRRARGRGDHAGRAARAPPAAQHRARHATRRSRSPRCRRWRTCKRAPPGAHARDPARGAGRRRQRALPRGGRCALRRVTTRCRSRWRR